MIESSLQNSISTLSASQVQTLNSLPLTIVPSPGPTRFIRLVIAFLEFTPGSEALTPGGNLQMFVNKSAFVEGSTTISAAFLTGNRAFGTILPGTLPSGTLPYDDVADLVGQPLFLLNGSSDFSGNTSLDCGLQMSVWYKIIEP